MAKQFTNGFDTWRETHFEVSSFIGAEQQKNLNMYRENVINETAESGGSMAVSALAEIWTDEFETLNKDREWDGEFFDEIEKFLTEKNKL